MTIPPEHVQEEEVSAAHALQRPRQTEVDPFRATFEAELDYVWTTLRRLGVRDADVEDVAHEVFLRVHARFADYDRSRPIRPWLFGFALRVAADYRKLARNRRELVVEGREPIDPAPLADEQLAAMDRRALVALGLEALDLDKRAVFVLHDLDGSPAQEIATALDLPLFTVYSRLRVARERFAAAVRRAQARGAGPQARGRS